ncbi:MAG: helix-turn-helix domain-containing protein [Ruminococcus flavefaciens]|nr:helix-turn-helix domain-containing protein [Ruminococcus flavefaciens]
MSRGEIYLMEILAKRLIKLRSERKLSRREVAASTGMTERTYQRYENAERDPSAPVLLALADYYDVTTDYLLGRTDERK